MFDQKAAQGHRCSLVEEHAHPESGGRETRPSELQNSQNSLSGHTGKPFEKLVHCGSILEVLE